MSRIGTGEPVAPARLDHLVVAASSLAQGVRWCERTLGLQPGPGGTHPLMGTHNRLLKIASPQHPQAYLEIIAVDPDAAPPGRRRWFDLDDAQLQAQLRRDGPQLVHLVAQLPDAQRTAQAMQALRALGLDRGELLAASRATPAGVLSWQITVRPDGRRLLDGTLPTLIAWGPVHPADSLPDSGLQLHRLTLRHPQRDRLHAACQAIGLRDVGVQAGDAGIEAVLQSDHGAITLASRPAGTYS